MRMAVLRVHPVYNDSYVYLGGGGGGLSEWKLCGVACTRAAGRARRYATLLGST